MNRVFVISAHLSDIQYFATLQTHIGKYQYTPYMQTPASDKQNISIHIGNETDVR